MRDADRPIGRLRKAPSPPARRKAQPARPLAADKARADLDALREYNRGPARGIVLGLAPALLIWAGLIALFAKLLK